MEALRAIIEFLRKKKEKRRKGKKERKEYIYIKHRMVCDPTEDFNGSYYYYEYSQAIRGLPVWRSWWRQMIQCKISLKPGGKYLSLKWVPCSKITPMFPLAQGALSGVPLGQYVSRELWLWEWFLLVSAWYFNWHIKLLTYSSFVFLIISLCGCRLSAERMY